MSDLKRISDYLRLKVLCRSYAQLLAHGADVLYGPCTASIVFNTFQAARAYLSILQKRLINNG